MTKLSIAGNSLNHMFIVFIKTMKGAEGANNYSTITVEPLK